MSEKPAFNPEQFKAATRAQWDKSGAGWNEQTPQIRAWLTEATARMLDLAQVKEGARVLDVAAGAGDQTLDIARRVGPAGAVLATDLSPGILALAAENAKRAGLTQVATQIADGEQLGVDAGAFDAAVCRLGLMFFPDPLKGLAGIHRALKLGGRFCAMVFSEPQKNPLLGIVVGTAVKHAGLPPPDPFQPGTLLSLGKPGLIDQLFSRAGFTGVATEKLDAPFRLPSAKDYLDFIRTSAGPILQIIGKLDATAQNAAWAEMEEKLGAFQTPSGWVGPNELLLAVGTR